MLTRSKTKNPLGPIKVKEHNTNFEKRFKQKILHISLNKKFQEEITHIRQDWKIPEKGFDHKKYGSEDFMSWLEKQKLDDYKTVTALLEDKKIVKAEPKVFLDLVYHSLIEDDDHEYPNYLYSNLTLKGFHSVINELPFPGIVHYILFNEEFVPESNELHITTSLVKVGINKIHYFTLHFGPNAGYNDIRDIFPVIEMYQKKLKGYNKNRIRRKKDQEHYKNVYAKRLVGKDMLVEFGVSKFRYDKLPKFKKGKERFKKRIEQDISHV